MRVVRERIICCNYPVRRNFGRTSSLLMKKKQDRLACIDLSFIHNCNELICLDNLTNIEKNLKTDLEER